MEVHCNGLIRRGWFQMDILSRCENGSMDGGNIHVKRSD